MGRNKGGLQQEEKKFLFVTIWVIIPMLFAMTGCSKTSSIIEDYLNTGSEIDVHAKEMMPTLDNLPGYEEIEYKYTNKTILFFQSTSVALIVKYDDQTYESGKEKLAENYTFVTSATSDVTGTSEYEFSINSYTFKIVGGNEFPKSFGMIGTSDEKQSIAYLYFYDFDLDNIGEEDDSNPMPNFVNQYFDYDF